MLASTLLVAACVSPSDRAFRPPGLLPDVNLRLPEGSSGSVLCAAQVSSQGRIVDRLIIAAKPGPLGPLALELLDRLKFAPGHRDGHPVTALACIAFRFDDGQVFVVAGEANGAAVHVGVDVLRFFQLPDLDRKPDLLVHVPPEYAAEYPGSVRLQYLIGPDGAVRMPTVIAADDEIAAESIVRALSQWRFSSPLCGGIPVSVLVQQEFRLRPDR